MKRFIVLNLVVIALFGCAGPRQVIFPTADGGVVEADVYGRGEVGVVLAHGGMFTKESWTEQAEDLADAGYRVLAFNFRGRGKSHGGPQENSRNDVHLDVLAAVRYLRKLGVGTVSVVGGSFGGWASARAAVAAKIGEIDRIVLLAASPIDHPELIKGRKLFIVSRDDPKARKRKRLVAIQDQYDRAQDPKELVVLEGSAHAQHIFKTEQGARLMREILRFLAQP